MNAKFSIWDNLVSNDSDKKLLNLLNIKRVWNFNIPRPCSLLSCRKLWRARYCCAQEGPAVIPHCLWHPGLRSPTNHCPLTGSC
jgi:hypothetical protein